MSVENPLTTSETKEKPNHFEQGQDSLSLKQEAEKHDVVDQLMVAPSAEIPQAIKKRGINIFKQPDDLPKTAELIQNQLLRNIGGEKRALENLQNTNTLVGEDLSSTVSELQNADFTAPEISSLLQASESGKLNETLGTMIDDEAKYIQERLKNPEFLQELDQAKARIKLMCLKLGVSDLAEKRWPKIVYAGRSGRMVNRTKNLNQFDTRACAAGEYLTEDNTAFIYLTSGSKAPAGKEILKTQIHETLHGISPNKSEDYDGVNVNESGFGTIENNDKDPLASKYNLLNFNEGFTEYFARQFTKESFGGQPIGKHEYDDNVKAVASFIENLSKLEGKTQTEVEEILFKSYIEGSKEKFNEIVTSFLGKYGEIILDILPKGVDQLFNLQQQYKTTGAVGESFEISADDLKKRGVSISDFKKEYPFVKLVVEEMDFETFEMKKKEVTTD